MLQYLSIALALFSVPLVDAGAPSICVPPKVDAANGYIYHDMTAECKKTGRCKEACVSFIQGGHCNRPFNAVETTNVQLGLYNQIKKEGWTSFTQKGPWRVGFGAFTTAIPNRDVGSVFNTALTRYMNSGKPLPLNIYFREVPVNTNQLFMLEAVRDNCN